MDNNIHSQNMTQQAEYLVDSARLMAMALNVVLCDEFIVLRNVQIKHWEFIVTVAGIFIATTRLRNIDISSDHEDALLDIVSEKADQWDEDAFDAFMDCKAFFEKEYQRLSQDSYYKANPGFLSSDIVGIWVVGNVLDESQDGYDKFKITRALGAMITHEFYNWWE